MKGRERGGNKESGKRERGGGKGEEEGQNITDRQGEYSRQTEIQIRRKSVCVAGAKLCLGKGMERLSELSRK